MKTVQQFNSSTVQRSNNYNIAFDYIYPPLLINTPNDFSTRSKPNLNINPDFFGFKISNDNSELKILINSPEITTINVRIIDIFGNILMKTEYTVQKGESRKFIDIRNLVTGIYIYSITIKGKDTLSGKISIVR